MDDTSAYVEVSNRYPCENCWVIDLNCITIGVTSNESELPGANYVCFRKASLHELEACDYRVSLHVRKTLASDEETWLAAHADRSFRGERFKSGFYVTHHFGAPAFLFTIGHNYFVVGSTLDKLLWSYFTKVFLTVEAERRGYIHLKAACVDVDGTGLLLAGRGSGGKTVMLFEACRNGGTFVANTHCVVQGRHVIGVHSPMRVRNDAVFARSIRALQASKHVEAGEYVLRPGALFPRIGVRTVAGAICIVDYRPDRPALIEPLGANDALTFLELFAFPTITYGIKDDILASVGGDHFMFCEMMKDMKNKLERLVAQIPAYYVSIDATRTREWIHFRNIVLEPTPAATDGSHGWNEIRP